jgi:hypothetical protein
MNRTFLLSALASTIALGSALAACGSRVICDGMCGGGGNNVVPGTAPPLRLTQVEVPAASAPASEAHDHFGGRATTSLTNL